MFDLSLHMQSSMVIKLVVGMLCVLIFLRISGKSQMSQMTPTDVVNSFVIGAIVGGTIYAPALSVWHMVFGIVVWTIINLFIHKLTKIRFFSDLFYGRVVFLVKDGKLDVKAMKQNKINAEQLTAKLREQRIFSLLDVDDVRLETDGQFTVFLKTEASLGFLLINQGSILEDNLKDAQRSSTWLKQEMLKLGYANIEDLYCVEWTPNRGFFVVDNEGNSSGITAKSVDLK
ncbi:DUF421 domain-containing protein [Wohlfahrtiimonas chitiniclastica]|uniref:DUF421 domain-containing protein n=1 Tax=Wohlfahrtiimonas chitiniclastica TaxID=400946 RepID=UPI001BCBC62D|nr:DUF421 domain-containing protein [Wohlfahrtiimonas chitiniclastica]MBS7815436.1 DUF421 domain-containing protein [Wohlfahrtiimonas chitiniclastica]